MQTVEIQGEPREIVGRRGLRQLRREGRTPGVLYGKGEKTLAFSINSHDFAGVLRRHGGQTFLIELKLKGQEDRELTAIIRELQRDPVSSAVLHVDLLHVSMTQLIQFKVPVHLVGTAIGVKEGGLLDQLAREVEIECQTSMIPEDLQFDVSELRIGDTIHVSDLVVPDGIRLLTPGDRVIGSVIAKLVVEEPVPAEVAEVEAKEGEEASTEKEADAGSSKEKKD